MSPLVSCIVPTRNGAKHLGETLRSLVEQTWRPLEVLVVDDGSTDGSAVIAAGFGPPVRVATLRASNPVTARNHGIRCAKGEFLSFLDHDDLYTPDKLALQMAAFEADPALDVCVGMVQRFRQATAEHRQEFVGGPIPGYLTITMLARRRAFDRVGLLDPQNFYSDSAEWFLRARALGIAVRLLDRTLVFHREHAGNRSLTHGDASRRDFLRLIKSKLDRERSAR
jgi:glycosyltransferase involved in cell wall biosynthesis